MHICKHLLSTELIKKYYVKLIPTQKMFFYMEISLNVTLQRPDHFHYSIIKCVIGGSLKDKQKNFIII